jgi:peptide chain release factor 1
LERSYFDAFSKKIRKLGFKAKSSETSRTFVIECDDKLYQEFDKLAGTHRVQRIPSNSSSRHTSTATVALIAKNTITLNLQESDIEETFDKGSGKGGQHQNTTDSAVTLKHLPTGVQVHIEGRSQAENRKYARKVLEDKVKNKLAHKAKIKENKKRKKQINSERSAKTFTHNYQRNEVVDHQDNTSYKLKDFYKGKF